MPNRKNENKGEGEGEEGVSYTQVNRIDMNIRWKMEAAAKYWSTKLSHIGITWELSTATTKFSLAKPVLRNSISGLGCNYISQISKFCPATLNTDNVCEQ